MFLQLDGNGALYAQLARALKRAILQGELKAGAALPATRALAAELGLSRNTVLTAYEMLCAEQLASARIGSVQQRFEKLQSESGAAVLCGLHCPEKNNLLANCFRRMQPAQDCHDLTCGCVTLFRDEIRCLAQTYNRKKKEQ